MRRPGLRKGVRGHIEPISSVTAVKHRALMQDELPLVYRASLPLTNNSPAVACLACPHPARALAPPRSGFLEVVDAASPYIPQVQACRALLPESSRYSQSVSFDACRFRADVAVLLVLAQSSRLLPVRGVVLLSSVCNLSHSVSFFLVHLCLFLVASRLCLDSLQDAIWTFEYC